MRRPPGCGGRTGRRPRRRPPRTPRPGGRPPPRGRRPARRSRSRGPPPGRARASARAPSRPGTRCGAGARRRPHRRRSADPRTPPSRPRAPAGGPGRGSGPSPRVRREWRRRRAGCAPRPRRRHSRPPGGGRSPRNATVRKRRQTTEEPHQRHRRKINPPGLPERDRRRTGRAPLRARCHVFTAVPGEHPLRRTGNGSHLPRSWFCSAPPPYRTLRTRKASWRGALTRWHPGPLRSSATPDKPPTPCCATSTAWPASSTSTR